MSTSLSAIIFWIMPSSPRRPPNPDRWATWATATSSSAEPLHDMGHSSGPQPHLRVGEALIDLVEVPGIWDEDVIKGHFAAAADHGPIHVG